MAIDDEEKRRRASGVGRPGVNLPEPDGVIDDADRAGLAGVYTTTSTVATRSALGGPTLALLESNTAYPIIFVELRINTSSSPQVITRLHTGLGTITWGGNDWTGAGTVATFEGVPEGVGLSPKAVRMGLSGIDSTITDIVFGTQYYRRPVLVYLGALSDGALAEDPGVIFSGFIESIDMVVGDEDGDTVMVTAESELILFKRSREVRYTDSRLQSEFSGDLGFEFLPQLVNKKVVWRGTEASVGRGGSRGGVPSGRPNLR